MTKLITLYLLLQLFTIDYVIGVFNEICLSVGQDYVPKHIGKLESTAKSINYGENKDHVEISLQAVRWNGRILSGWLSFEVNLKQDFENAFVQVSDQDANAIGDFMELKRCIGTYVFPPQSQILPCSATGPQEASVSQAFASKKVRKVPTTVKFLWKLDEYYCNRHEKFQIVVYTVKDGNAVFYRGPWIKPKWFGVADIVRTMSSVINCNEPIEDAAKHSEWWIETSEGTDDNRPAASCRTFIPNNGEKDPQPPKFGGRCEKKSETKSKGLNSETSSVDVPHACIKNDKATYPDPADVKGYEPYDKYLEKRATLWGRLCNDNTKKCPELSVQAINISSERAKWKDALTRYAKGRYIMKSRAYHGLTMTWGFFFFLPFSNFVARYFKETFLDMDVIGLRLWYFIHIGGVFWTLTMIVTALTASFKVNLVYGYSWAHVAQQHVIWGWTCVALFVVSILMGPIRPVSVGPRKIFMKAHAALGFFVQFLGMCLIVSSTVIPGSPSASYCYTHVYSNVGVFQAPFEHQITAMVMWFFGLEIVFHFIMSKLQVAADRSWRIQRTMYFPLIPVVKFGDRRSYKFFRYRTMVLIIYTTILLIFVAAIWTHLYSVRNPSKTNFNDGHHWFECDAGPMTCTHDSDSKPYNETKCGRLAKLRAIRMARDLP